MQPQQAAALKGHRQCEAARQLHRHSQRLHHTPALHLHAMIRHLHHSQQWCFPSVLPLLDN